MNNLLLDNLENDNIKFNLENAVSKWNINGDYTTISPLYDNNKKVGFFIYLDMFHYKFNDDPELMLFELEISNHGLIRSIRVNFCENGFNTDCWDALNISPNKINMQNLLEHVKKSSENGTKIEYDELKLLKFKKSLDEKINYFEKTLKTL